MSLTEQLGPIWLPLALLLAAVLYAAVGHGGASAYLVIFGLVGMSPEEMKPIAWTLNIAVSLLALIAYAGGGHFRGRLFWWLAVASVPAAFLGGCLQSPEPVFEVILAVALLCGAWRLVLGGTVGETVGETVVSEPRLPAVLGLGGVLGLLSGLIGIGGGIFLTPLLILFRWAPAKPAAAVSAAFVFANSLSGLSGLLVKGGVIPGQAWALLPAVVIGGWLGSWWGSRRAGTPALRRSLAAVLVVAAAKLAIT